MADTVADVLLSRLREWDIKQVFGVSSVKDSARIELVVRLEMSKDDGNFDRIGLENHTATLHHELQTLAISWAGASTRAS